MKYIVNSDAPDEVVAKVKRLLLKEIKGKKPERVELKFNDRLDHCKVVDVDTFQTIARFDLNYKEDETEIISTNGDQ